MARGALEVEIGSGARIWRSSSPSSSSCLPERKRMTLVTLAAYSSGVTAPAHGPGPSPTW